MKTNLSCKDAAGEVQSQFIPIKTFPNQPFLGEIFLEDYDFEKGNQYFLDGWHSMETGACSSCRVGNYHGRNLDCYLREDYGILVIHLPAKENRYASVGVVSFTLLVNRAMIANGKILNTLLIPTKRGPVNLLSILPTATMDGINEKGVCVNCNVVLHEDGAREDYIPCTGLGEPRVAFLSLPRYVLDHCSSVQDAIEQLSKLSVAETAEGVLAKQDLHLMISDSIETAIVEWRNNQFAYINYSSVSNFKSPNGLPCVMTNYFISQQEKHTLSGETNWDAFYESHPYAMGVERDSILSKNLAEGATLEGMKQLMKRVLYSQIYDSNSEKPWYTENANSLYFKKGGQWYYLDNGYQEAKNYKEAMTKAYWGKKMMGIIKNFESFDKQMKLLEAGKGSDKWYTEYTLIYDIADKSFYILPQEGWYDKEYIKVGLE